MAAWRHAVFLALLLVTGLVLAAENEPARVEVVFAEFGTFDASNPQEVNFVPTRVVPHRVGQRYGWVIDVATTRRSLGVREEYLLPMPAKAKAAEAANAIDTDIPLVRRNQVSQRQLVPENGRIVGEWEIGPNEPAGHRHLQVLIEGDVAADFEYDVK